MKHKPVLLKRRVALPAHISAIAFSLLIAEVAHSQTTVEVDNTPVVHNQDGASSTYLAFPDVCHTPFSQGPIPIPYSTAGTPTDDNNKKPTKSQIAEIKAWLDKIESTANLFQEALKKSTAPKPKVAIAVDTLKKVGALLAGGRAAIKDPQTNGEMYKKILEIQGELVKINYPTLLKEKIAIKKK